MTVLTDQEKKRYYRHLVLNDIGETGQLKLRQGRVLVVGSGGLGSPVLFYLAAAGVGTLGVVDCDTVDISNLNRQILHNTEDLGKPKTVSAYEKLSRLNPDISITTANLRLTEANAVELLSDYQVVVDATDNFPTRYILNEACAKLRLPFIHGGISGFFGQVTTIISGHGPCFQCLFRDPPPPDALPAAPGVLGAVAGTIGTLQVGEAVKIILGKGKLLTGRLLMYDALEMSFREIAIKRDPACPICGKL